MSGTKKLTRFKPKFVLRPVKNPDFDRTPSKPVPPCRCGGQARVDYDKEEREDGEFNYAAIVYCSKCHISIIRASICGYDKAEQSARKAWKKVMWQETEK